LPIVTLPFTYPAYKAVLWRWWVCGIRFGEVRLNPTCAPAGSWGFIGPSSGGPLFSSSPTLL
jgi:hypothetical protein